MNSMKTAVLNLYEKNKLVQFSFIFIALALNAHLIRLLKKLRSRDKKLISNTESISSERFWSNFQRLLNVCFPRYLSLEFLGLLLECYIIYVRSSLTIKAAQRISSAGRHLVEGKRDLLITDLVDTAFLAIPGTIAHVGVWHVRSLIKERIKDNLHRRLSQLYFSGNNMYYLTTSGLLENPERRFVEDSIKFCNTFMNLFEALLKPVVNIITLSIELSKSGGVFAPGLIASFYAFVASFKALILPDFSELMATAEAREAKLRTAHNVLVQHAEEVAFYGGESREREHAGELMDAIVDNEHRVKKSKWVLALFDSILIKYGSVFIGFIVCGAIVNQQQLSGTTDKATMVGTYFKCATLTMPLLKALGKLLTLNLKLAALRGSVQRVSEVRDVLVRVGLGSKETENESTNEHYCTTYEELIEFSHVDITTPNNHILLKDFTLTVRPHSHVLILGKNGSGKSAIVRAFMEIWPISVGRLAKPSHEAYYIVPQRVYLPPGNFKSQLTFPKNPEDVDDVMVLKYAAALGLGPVIDRVGGLHVERDWQHLLSGGERQRVSLVRVLVHQPVFAILDECTSAVSLDDERSLYLALQQAGITLITIAHRESLKELHDVLVELNKPDDEGHSYTVSAIERSKTSNFSPLTMLPKSASSTAMLSKPASLAKFHSD